MRDLAQHTDPARMMAQLMLVMGAAPMQALLHDGTGWPMGAVMAAAAGLALASRLVLARASPGTSTPPGHR